MERGHLRNLAILFVGIVAGIFLYSFQPFRDLLSGLGSFGYLGAFLAGIAYDSTFTVSTSVAALIILAQSLPSLGVVLIAAIGAVIGDYLVFRFVKDTVLADLRPVWLAVVKEVDQVPGLHLRALHLKHLLKTHYFHWTLPVVAAIMIGSPFPNELAVGLMSLTKIKTSRFLVVSFTVNLIGIFLIISAARAIIVP